MSIDKYVAVLRINFMNSIAYLGDTVFHTLTNALYVFMLLQVWVAVYSKGQLFDLTLGQLLWYAGIAQVIYLLGGKPVLDISDLIQKGDIVNQLNKPYSFIAYHFFDGLGKRLFKGAIGLFWIALVVSIYSPFPMVHISLLLVLVPLVLGLIINYLVGFSIATLAFWVEDAKPYHWIWEKLMFILGGLLFPITLLPHTLQVIATHLPLTYVLYYPTLLFVDFSWDLLVSIVVIQVILVGILSLITLGLFTLGVKQVTSNGG